MSVKSVRLDKGLAVGLVCASLFGSVTIAVAPAWAQAPAKDAASDEAQPASERGHQRSELLVRLLGGQHVLPLEPTNMQADIVEPLRLDEAVALALKNNFEVQAAGAKTESADWDVVGAYASYLPTISYSRSTGRERSRPASYNDANDNRVPDDNHRRRDKELTVRQPVVDVSLIAEILVRHKSQTATQIEASSTRERIAMQTVTAYLQIIAARLLTRYAEDYKAQLDKLNDLMKSRVEGGGAAQAELDRIKARSVSAQSAIIETRSAFDAAMDEFRRLTGVTPLQFQLPASLLPAQPATIEDALVRALRFNPDYLLSEKQVEVQRGERDKAYSRLLPKLTVEFSQSRSWNAGGAALGNSTSGDAVFPYQDERRTMLVTSWTFTGGTDITAGLSANAKAREANFKSLDTRARVEQLVRTSYNALTAAGSRVPVLEQAIESNAKVVSAFEEQYANASRPLFDLLDAYERNYTARSDLTRVMLAESQAGHQLRQQMGDLVAALKESEDRVKQAEAGVAPEPEAKAKTEPAEPSVEAAPRDKVTVEPKNGKRGN